MIVSFLPFLPFSTEWQRANHLWCCTCFECLGVGANCTSKYATIYIYSGADQGGGGGPWGIPKLHKEGKNGARKRHILVQLAICPQ